MKKYLMTAVAALALGGLMTSCTKEDFAESASQDILQQYEQVFTTAFGTPAPNQTWGFGENTSTASTRATTRYNPGDNYAETSTGINANANEWADPADASHGHGGWVVPDPLTDEQKSVVTAYFQSVKDLTYEDPHFRHFFVQQVYSGGSSTVRNTTEGIIGADGTQYSSNNMNLLTVGYNEQHINNFNGGTYGVNGIGGASYVNVLDNGSDKQAGIESYHPDQIMLMVNIDDTECMGYHSTGSSIQKNNKAALVSWETIRTWANANGLNGDCLIDGWNRSFVGFDLELYSLEQSYLKDGSGNNVYAKMSDGQNSGLQYVWDGENVIPKEGESGFGDYLMVDGNKIPYLITNTNMYGGEMYGGKDEALSDNDMKITVDGKECFNMKKIEELYKDGYLPVKDKNLRTWVKWQGGDGYFSDWIVTLTEAKRIDDDSDPDVVRIIAEDLTWGSENGDFDFNDVVFDVKLSEDKQTITITLRAAGGTLPLRIAGQYEVHEKFGVPTGIIVNTGTDLSVSKSPVSWSFANSDSRNYKLENGQEVAQSYGSTVKEVAYNLPVEVYKTINGTKVWVELQAPVGKAAAKVAVDNTYIWCEERHSIDETYYDYTLRRGKFSMYVKKERPYAEDNSWYK